MRIINFDIDKDKRKGQGDLLAFSIHRLYRVGHLQERI